MAGDIGWGGTHCYNCGAWYGPSGVIGHTCAIGNQSAALTVVSSAMNAGDPMTCAVTGSRIGSPEWGREPDCRCLNCAQAHIPTLLSRVESLRRERDEAIAEASEYKLAYETCHKNACEAIAALESIIGIVDANARFFGITKSAEAELDAARQIVERSRK